MTKTYECEHCGYIGPCPQTPMANSQSSVSVPLCKQCRKSDQLIPVVIEKMCMLRKNCPIPYEQNGPNCSPMNCDGWIGL